VLFKGVQAAQLIHQTITDRLVTRDKQLFSGLIDVLHLFKTDLPAHCNPVYDHVIACFQHLFDILSGAGSKIGSGERLARSLKVTFLHHVHLDPQLLQRFFVKEDVCAHSIQHDAGGCRRIDPDAICICSQEIVALPQGFTVGQHRLLALLKSFKCLAYFVQIGHIDLHAIRFDQDAADALVLGGCVDLIHQFTATV